MPKLMISLTPERNKKVRLYMAAKSYSNKSEAVEAILDELEFESNQIEPEQEVGFNEHFDGVKKNGCL